MRRETRDRTFEQRGFSDQDITVEFDSLLSDDGTLLDRLETRDLSDAEFLGELSDEEEVLL